MKLPPILALSYSWILKGAMMKTRKILILLLLVSLAAVVFGCITIESPLEHSEVIATLNDYQLPGGYYEYWVEHIQAGRQVCISWQADGAVSVYILTETQYDYFKVWGFTARYIAYDKARSGTLCRKIANTDTYYLIIKNSSLFETYKIYSAEAKVTWWS